MPAKRVILWILAFLLFGLRERKYSFFCSGYVSSLKINSISFEILYFQLLTILTAESNNKKVKKKKKKTQLLVVFGLTVGLH